MCKKLLKYKVYSISLNGDAFDTGKEISISERDVNRDGSFVRETLICLGFNEETVYSFNKQIHGDTITISYCDWRGSLKSNGAVPHWMLVKCATLD